MPQPETEGPRLARSPRFSAGSAVSLIMSGTTSSLGSMPLASAADMLIAQAVGAGYTADDFATLILEQARRSGYALEAENVEVDDGLAAEEA